METQLRTIHSDLITEKVAELCIKANVHLPHDIRLLIDKSIQTEQFKIAKDILKQIDDNYKLAEKVNLPICQDTGMAIVFVEIGQDVHIVGQALYDAINQGVAKGYNKGYLRKSVVADPIRRINTKDNTPAVIHVDIVPGNNIKITVSPKGFGSENMSAQAMLNPSDGMQGVRDFVINTVFKAGARPCPPLILGVGIGGSFEKSALLSKKALTLPLDKETEDEFYRNEEKIILDKINELGIGPQGFGGKTTALAVKILAYPTHIAGLPVAVNVGCHVTRHVSCII